MLAIMSGTGVVAREAVAQLANLPMEKCLIAQEAVPPELRGEFDLSALRFSDVAAIERALAGATHLFLFPRIEPGLTETLGRFIDAAKKAGVGHVVLVSFIGADSTSGVRVLRWLGAIEEQLMASGLGYTILRTAPFMQSLILFASKCQCEQSIIAPFRDTRFPWLDACDLGKVVAKLVSEPLNKSTVFELTGPQALSFPEVAGVISDVIGTPFSYIDVTAHEARGHLEASGLTPLIIITYAEWWDALASGLVELPVAQDLKKLLGRSPSTLKDFVTRHLSCFGGDCEELPEQSAPAVVKASATGAGRRKRSATVS